MVELATEGALPASSKGGYGTSQLGHSTSTKPNVPTNLTSAPQSGHIITRLTVSNIDSPQFQEALQWTLATDSMSYLQFIKRKAAAKREVVQCQAEREATQQLQPKRESACWFELEMTKLQQQ